MTLENIYYVGQTVAVVAILGSLVFLAIQNRQSQQQMDRANTGPMASRAPSFPAPS